MSRHQQLRAWVEQGREDLAWDDLTEALCRGPYPTRQSARRALRALAPRLHPDAWDERRLGTLERLQVGTPDLQRRTEQPAIGLASFPVTADQGHASRFVDVQVEPADDVDRFPAGLSPDALQAGRQALQAVRRLVPGHPVHVQLQTLDWDGPSWTLALGLAALSSIRRVPVRHAATGHLRSDGRVEDVGGRSAKRRLRAAARPRGLLLTPASWSLADPALVPCATLAEAWQHAAGVPHDLDAELARLRTQQREGDWAGAAARAACLLDEPWSDDERAELLCLLLDAANHTDDADGRHRWATALGELDGLTGSSEVRARALGARVVRAVDALDPKGARSLLASLDPLAVDAASRIHLLGPAAMVALLEGRFEQAVALRRQATQLAPVAERARCWGDLADALQRAGHADQAWQAVQTALEHSRCHRRPAYQDRTRRFLALHEARQAASRGDVQAALRRARTALPGAGLDPSIRLELLVAELTRDPGRVSWIRERFAVRPGTLVDLLCDATAGALGDERASSRVLSQEVFAGLSLAEARRRLPY